MPTYTLAPRQIPLDDSWDVMVAGGGPAGCAAAIAAAREGAKTLLVEATGALGGMSTSGLVPAWAPLSDQERIIYRGLAEKVIRQCQAGMPHVPPEKVHWIPIDTERLKRIYDDMVTFAGATVRFNTMLSAVEHDGDGRVRALVLSNKAGLSAIRAKVYVDCTGDADLAAWAGAEYHKGDDKDKDLQPATLCFVLANVDTYAYQFCGSLKGGSDPIIQKILRSGKYPRIADIHSCNNLVGPGVVGFNAGHLWNVDNTDPDSVSKAMMEGRRIAEDFRAALAEFHPRAFGNAWLAATGSLMGIRETRRIVGDYVLTIEDFLARRSFPDEICRNCYYIDVHHSRAQAAAVNADPQAHAQRAIRYGKGESHGIPYRCLVPRGLENVLVAGRSISTDRLVQGSTRVMPVCLAMGEAAGLAAAMAVDAGGQVRRVDVPSLRKRLQEYGAYLPPSGAETPSQEV